MVRRDDGEIARLQFRLQLRQPPIEGLERRGIAGNVAAVAEDHVEVDEVDHRQVAVSEGIDDGQRLVEEGVVVRSLDHLADAMVGKDVGDLADADDPPLGGNQPVEERRLRRRHGEVAAVGGADEITRARPDEGTRDDAADVERIAEPASALA